MKNLKKILILLLFVSIVAIINNVNAQPITYGSKQCDYDCSLININYGNNNICHDNWKPENNSCMGKSAPGSSLTIDYIGNSVNMLGTTELFGKNKSLFVEGAEVKRAGIAAGTKNVFVYTENEPASYNGQTYAIFIETAYIHDFRPLIEYYELAGKYPEYVVADLTGKSGSFLGTGIAALPWFKYTYYPSDFQTTEHEYKWSNGLIMDNFINLFGNNPHDWDPDFMGDVNSSDIEFRNMCRNLEYVAYLKSMPPLKCSQDTSGSATIHYFFSTNQSENSSLMGCDDLKIYISKAKEAFQKDGHSSEEYNNMLEKIAMGCKAYDAKKPKSEKYDSDVCWNLCDTYDDEMMEMDDQFAIYTNHCGFGQDMVAWIIRALKILRYIVPIIVIVMSTVEYIGAIGSADDDAMKKAGNRFSKRLLIMIIFFVIPSLLQFIINVFNIDGFDSSNPYCMKF